MNMSISMPWQTHGMWGMLDRDKIAVEPSSTDVRPGEISEKCRLLECTLLYLGGHHFLGVD